MTVEHIAARLEQSIREEGLLTLPAEVDGETRRALTLLEQVGSVVDSGDGTFVTGPLLAGAAQSRPPTPPGARDLASGNPAIGLLLRSRPAIAEPDLLYGEPRIVPEFQALMTDLLHSMGVAAGAMMLQPGGLEAIDRILGLFTKPGDRVIVEYPTYNGDALLLRALGLRAVPVPVDDYGLCPESFAVAAGTATACLVRPRAQNPTGAAMDAGRAAQLRAVTSANPELLVIEEDHAGPIAGTDYHSVVDAGRSNWLYVASVSKWMGPDYRLAVVTGDDVLVRWLDQRRLLGGGWVSRRSQLAVASALGALQADVALTLARRTYCARRSGLVEVLRSAGVRATGSSGLNVWVEVERETETVARLLTAGWLVAPGSRFGVHEHGAIRVTISDLETDDANRFAACLLRGGIEG